MIHKYKYKNKNIVLDVNSGSIHLVDDVTYDVLDYYEEKNEAMLKELGNKYSAVEINECLEEIEALKKDNLLYAPDIMDKLGEIPHESKVVKALCLHIAHDCNLKCVYCFAGEGEYHGGRSLMSAETGKRALDFIVASSGNRRNLEIDFFGGEPTINFGAVKEIVQYGRELEKIHNKYFRFTLTTNAVYFTEEMMEFCNNNMSNVVLSIDGRKAVNDRMRPNKSGAGSYDTIVPNILRFSESRGGKNYYVRGTFTRHNLDFSEDVLHLSELGFGQISIEPVVAPPEAHYSIRKQDLDRLFDEYDRLTDIMCERVGRDDEFNFFHFDIDLTGGSCALKRISGCGAGCEYMSVTPEGDLYPCHQFTGIPEFKLGTVFGGIDINKEDLIRKFSKIDIYSKEECKNCWAKFYCSGGCAANAYNFGGSISSNYEIGCELQKKRIECSIYLSILRKGWI